jgi:hypothetical protein
MNKIILYGLILFLFGCTTSLPILKEKPESLVDGKGDFVELFDGTIIQGPISEERNKNIVINGNYYHVKNIKSYQYKSKYRTTYKNTFVTRTIKGKINVFKRTSNSPGDMFGSTSMARAGSSATYYYIQKGDAGKVEFFDIKTLEEMVKDNPKALYWVNEYKKLKKKNDSYLDYAIEAYNTN